VPTRALPANNLSELSLDELLERAKRIMTELEAIAWHVEELALEQRRLNAELSRRGGAPG
jgi:hypothetical protein